MHSFTRGVHVKNVSEYCGRRAHKFVQSMRTSTISYAHNPPHMRITNFVFLLCTFTAQTTHQVLHTNFVQFIPVYGRFYTQSTGLTITTTYINK